VLLRLRAHHSAQQPLALLVHQAAVRLHLFLVLLQPL
jgi:hypothetical protein